MNLFVITKDCPVRQSFPDEKSFGTRVRNLVESLEDLTRYDRVAVLEMEGGLWAYHYWSLQSESTSGQITSSGNHVFVTGLFSTEERVICLIAEQLVVPLDNDCNRLGRSPEFLL